MIPICFGILHIHNVNGYLSDVKVADIELKIPTRIIYIINFKSVLVLPGSVA